MPTFPIHLLKHAQLQGSVMLRSGIHIGGSKDDIEIGGTDSPVVRDPVSKEPYIPGSSLKGKMRNLLEQRYPQPRQNTERPCGCARPTCPVCTLFGPHFTPRHELGPSRLIVRDAFLTDTGRQNLEAPQAAGFPMTEIKTENWIDRRTGIAGQGGLRNNERVLRTAEFELSFSLRVFNGDDEAQLKRWVDEAISLLQDDALGGSGTRGYGWVKIEHRWVS